MMVRCSVFDVLLFTFFSAGVTGQYGNCTAEFGTINDGRCDTANNNADCGFDGGDCCECSCVEDGLFPCGIWGFNCLDPDAAGGPGNCQNENASVGPSCSTDSPQTWFVEDTASASSLTEAVNCSGGTFDVRWRGRVFIDQPIHVPDGTTMYLTGEGSGAEVNGGGKTRLFTAAGAALHIDSMTLSNGSATYGGAIAALRSGVFINQTSCSGNIATSYGGAVYVGRSSTLVWYGQATLEDNHAGRGGGGVVVNMNSTVSWDGQIKFSCSTTTGDVGFGGAVYVKDHSRVSWNGVMSSINNTASSNGGAFYVSDNSTISWDGAALFINNTASSNGGAFYVSDNSIASWDGITSFTGNTASSYGGAFLVNDNSIASWHGITSFTGNTASSYGGGCFVNNNSTISWDGVTSFISNNAADEGGAFFVSDNSNVAWDGVTSFISNTATVGLSLGGALCLKAESRVSWNGKTFFVGNMATGGGALFSYNSIVSWYGVTSFIANSGVLGGGIYAYNNSDISWHEVTTFISNMANADGGQGGALLLDSGSDVSWTAETSFVNNTADNGGALAVVRGSTVSWMGKTSFTGNNASSSGGVIYVITGSTIIVGGDTYFSENGAGIDGGAVYVYVGYDEAVPSYVILDNGTAVLFHGNLCGFNGGSIALIGAVVTQLYSNTTFSESSAGVAGGAVYMSGVSLGLRFEGARFISNSAVIGGGVYSTGSGTAITEDEYGKPQENPTTFIGCVFNGNRALKTGGALDSGAGIDLIVSTSFLRNTAAIGGALRLVGTLSLEECEFIENLSDEDEGPGISNDGVISDVSSCTFVDNVFNCQPGFYLEYNETDALYDTVCKGCDIQCNECTIKGNEPMCLEELEHSSAAGGNITLDFLSIKSGYWRATTTSINILACYNTKACLGGVTGEEGYCSKGYEGPYCSVCSEGYTAGLGFVCTKCSDNIAGGIALAAVGTILLLLVFIAFLSFILSGKSEDTDQGIMARVTRYIPLNSVKIVIVVWQILTQFSTVANVVFPSVYQDFLDSMDILNFDLTWVLSAGCIVDTDFHDELLFATLGPLVPMAILGVTYVVAMHSSCDSEDARKVIRHKHVSMVLLLTFLIYSTVSSTLFKTFACDDLDDGKVYLRADYRIECSSSKHTALMIYASFMVILYVVGIPASYGVILYRNREALTKVTDREEDEVIKPITDLWKPYRPERFYYEVIECVRRVLLTGALVFIYPSTAAQIAVALMMTTFFMIVSEALAPYASPWDTWCSRMGHAIVFTTIFLALLLKVDVSGERASSQKIFESALIAAHSCLVLIVVVEAIAVIMAWRQGVSEDIAPRIRPSLSVSTSAVDNSGTCLEEDEAPPCFENGAIDTSIL